MDYRIVTALVAMLVAATVLVGCEKKETVGEPPIQIGMAPGELETYQEQTPVSTTTTDDSAAGQETATSGEAKTATTPTTPT
ncbi:MAG: hypothetical protein GWP05_05885, partial [Anaerolineaceae bacterium]|nr:hypothetical protein [Anaerolineaceae bacterium]